MYIDIEGIPQWVQIDSNDLNKPAILLVHGGPGASTRFTASAWESWLDHFTLVHWDQRGTGRTLAKNGPSSSQPMTFYQIVRDGIGVTEYLRNQLKKKQIFVLGHSWGTAIAIHMIKRRPELFTAFAGTGLLVNFEQNEKTNYQRELLLAQQSCNQAAINALESIGPPPYRDLDRLKTLREWADKLTDGTGDAPYPRLKPPGNFSAEDREAMMQGFTFSSTALFQDLCDIDLPAVGTEFEIPMFCLMGSHDQQTPIELAERYFNTLRAPRKEFVRFEGCHHFVHMNRPNDFLNELIKLFLTPVRGTEHRPV